MWKAKRLNLYYANPIWLCLTVSIIVYIEDPSAKMLNQSLNIVQIGVFEGKYAFYLKPMFQKKEKNLDTNGIIIVFV